MVLETIRARDGKTLVPLSYGEMALLIRHGSAPVSARFGAGGTALVAEDSPWALPMLAEWRGVAFSEGAGI